MTISLQTLLEARDILPLTTHVIGVAPFVEDGMHTLRDCPREMYISGNFHSIFLNDLFMNDCQIWFKHHVMLNTWPLFVVTCWEILRWFMILVTHKNIQSIVTFVGIPPVNTYLKVNVDGSSFDNLGNAGFGGLIINHHGGGWIQGFSGSCSRASNWFVELSTNLWDLQLTWDLDYRSIIWNLILKRLWTWLLLIIRMNFIIMQLFFYSLKSSPLFIGWFPFPTHWGKVINVSIGWLNMGPTTLTLWRLAG